MDDQTSQDQAPNGTEPVAPAASPYDYDAMDYRGSQENAKSRGINAGGTQDELLARLRDADANPPVVEGDGADEHLEPVLDGESPASVSAEDALAAATAKIQEKRKAYLPAKA